MVFWVCTNARPLPATSALTLESLLQMWQFGNPTRELWRPRSSAACHQKPTAPKQSGNPYLKSSANQHWIRPALSRDNITAMTSPLKLGSTSLRSGTFRRASVRRGHIVENRLVADTFRNPSLRCHDNSSHVNWDPGSSDPRRFEAPLQCSHS